VQQLPQLKFIVDMNLSPLTVSQLRERGWKIIRVSEVMDARTDDIDILNYARDHNQVVFTNDLDFSELLAVNGCDSPSVINLRLENMYPGFVTQRIIDIVSQLEDELKKGIVVSVDDISARFRDLPITRENKKR
jgi:predicted nuclease of predicted toxin-antitoxin system